MSQSDRSGTGGAARRDGGASSTDTVEQAAVPAEEAAEGASRTENGSGSASPSRTSAARTWAGRFTAKAADVKDTDARGADVNGADTKAGETTAAASAKSSDRSDERPGPARPATGSAASASEKTSDRARPSGASVASGTPAKKSVPAASRTPAAARKPRRARLRLTQVDAWTVMKTAFLLSIAIGIVSVVAVAVIWTVLGVAGVFDSMNDTVQTMLGNDFRVQDYIGTGRILGFTMIVAVVNVFLLTAITTLGAFLYNLSATLLGGVEITLTEDG